MNIKQIMPLNGNLINVIVETPKNSRNKFDYDEMMDVFKLNKTLPAGMIFPFDFGFVPNTKAPDGDPLDVLVITEQQSYPGCLLECRIIGVLKAEQTERDKKKMRNDRIIAISDCSVFYKGIKKISSLGKEMSSEIESFFINYNKLAGKKFKPLAWEDEAFGLKLVQRNYIESSNHK